MCSRRHQRRIIQAKTQHEYHENNFGHIIQNQLNIKVDTNSNNASDTFESINNDSDEINNDFDEMFTNKSNTSFDFEQYEISNEILNDDNYESPSNFSDKSYNNELIDKNDTNIDTLKVDLSQ